LALAEHRQHAGAEAEARRRATTAAFFGQTLQPGTREVASTQPDICDSRAMADTETCRHCGEARHTPEDSCLTIAQRAGPMMGWLILAVVAAFILLIVVSVLG
jgi:hypothetical protein